MTSRKTTNVKTTIVIAIILTRLLLFGCQVKCIVWLSSKMHFKSLQSKGNGHKTSLKNAAHVFTPSNLKNILEPT